MGLFASKNTQSSDSEQGTPSSAAQLERDLDRHYSDAQLDDIYGQAQLGPESARGHR
ncbi:hypothetical protein [Streptomyces sp. WMMC1477]|uniref:hypothetical protein n=1 Tax=Streptomyces sp. WMMC1477 TaxID=3015155 RepID=UPI0022B7442A|nr:hypothetical protein [Streptomyces sp. WMMC1477]MCZ7430125.1 hypothetical protein [Streptomyces sp. WMMC1477]